MLHITNMEKSQDTVLKKDVLIIIQDEYPNLIEVLSTRVAKGFSNNDD